MNTQIINFSKHAEVNDIAQLLHENGFTLIIPNNETPTSFDTYFHFSKNDKIGYAQRGDFGGIRFSTVNVPCKQCGCGFGLQNWDEAIPAPTIKDAEKAFIIAPNWAKSSDVEAVRKYKNLDEFLSKERILKYIVINPA